MVRSLGFEVTRHLQYEEECMMGRPVSYEQTDVLRQAAQLFRFRGFRSVTVQSIVEATGLNRFAIYEKFGGKEGLFYAALEFYVEVPVKQDLLREFRTGQPGLGELLALLDDMRAKSLHPDAPAGCLIINASIELGGKDERVEQIVGDFSQAMKDAFMIALSGSQGRGELIEGRPVEDRADYLVTMINAFMVLAHVSRESADQLMRAVIDEVRCWRRGRPGFTAVSA